MAPRERRITAALTGFLGTYTSRYAEWRGYWLWGFLVGSNQSFDWNLLEPVSLEPRETPVEEAQRLAVVRFGEQAAKTGAAGAVLDARLVVQVTADHPFVIESVLTVPAWRVEMTASAIGLRGRVYQRRAEIRAAVRAQWRDAGLEVERSG